MPRANRARILVCDDAKTIRTLISSLLADEYEILAVGTATEALSQAPAFMPDLIISDLLMEGMDGYELCRQVRLLPELAQIPFVLLTSKTDEESRATGLEVGADDYLFKPLKPRELIARVRSLVRLRFANLELDRRRVDLEHMNEQLSMLALQDGLTGLYNHRSFQQRLREEISRAQRYVRPLTLAFFDLDHFKQLNDTHGHLMGDEVLKKIGEMLNGAAHLSGRRQSDVVARYGGEELVMLLPETERVGGVVKAQRVCEGVAQLRFSIDAVRVTLSAGVAEFPRDASSAEELIQRADEALYQAKHRGRNRVVAQGDWATEPQASVQPLSSYRTAVRETFDIIQRNRFLSIFYIDLSELQRVEKEYGTSTFHETLHALVVAVRADDSGVIAAADLITAGDPGQLGLVFIPNQTSARPADSSELEKCAQRLTEVVELAAVKTLRSLVPRPTRVSVGYAIGIDTRHYSHDRQIELLVRDAMRSAQAARMRREEREKFELQSLLLGDALYSLYQPIVAPNGSEIMGYEALIRGPHGRFESAGALLHAASLSDLEWELDRCCLRSAFTHAVGLKREKMLSVNVLPSTLYDREFGFEWFVGLIAEAKFSPEHIILEVTEQSVISNLERFREALAPLRRAGIKIALDDVGVANANLEQISAILPDFIKLDRVIIDGVAHSPSRLELVRSMVALARSIGAKVIGEGVENASDWEALKTTGIDYLQGFYFAQPEVAFADVLER